MASYGSLPFLEQLEFFRGKVNLPTERWDDLLGSAHDTAFVVAGAMKADLLEDLRAAVTKGIEQGTTLEEFRRDFDALVKRRGWTGWTGEGTVEGEAWRTRVIYETNLRTSYAAGRWAQIQEVKADRPYLEYRHNDSVLTPRPQHVAWDGLVLSADDPWWQTHYPPNGWGCKCRVFALSEDDLKDLGKDGPDQAPDSPIDPKTGAPVGIDKGWDYAPGAAIQAERAAEKAARLGQIAKDLKADLDAPPPMVGPGWHEPIPTDLDAVLERGKAREAELLGASAKNMDRLKSKLEKLEAEYEEKREVYLNTDDESPEWKMNSQEYYSAFKSVNAQKKAGANAIARLQKAMQAKVAEREALMRAQGLTVPTAKDKAAKLIIDHYAGEDLKELRKNAESFYKQFGATADTVKAVGNWRDRAYCSETLDDFHTVNMGTSAKSARVLFHEFGHSVEFTNKTAATARAWYMRRATGPAAPLRDLTKSPNYEADEMAYPGPFFDAYVAKDYGDRATEVMSMGLQNFTDPNNLLSFFLKDREHFRLVLGLLAL